MRTIIHLLLLYLKDLVISNKTFKKVSLEIFYTLSICEMLRVRLHMIQIMVVNLF